MTNQTGIRRYGPGKFDTILDAYVYELSMDGCDDEAGDNGYGPCWYGLLRGFTTDAVADRLNEDEKDVLRQSAGAIICEGSQGFVSVEYFDQTADLDTAWRQIVADMEEEEG